LDGAGQIHARLTYRRPHTDGRYVPELPEPGIIVDARSAAGSGQDPVNPSCLRREREFVRFALPEKNLRSRSFLHASFWFAQQNREWINTGSFRKESGFGNHFPIIGARNNYSSIVPAKIYAG
jgi:hypothetical protein